jgi:hypothetical protein
MSNGKILAAVSDENATMTTMTAKKVVHGGFRKLEMSQDVEFRPKEAAERIVGAYQAAKGDLDTAAAVFNATGRTLRRWVDKLKLRGKLAEIDKGLARSRSKKST